MCIKIIVTLFICFLSISCLSQSHKIYRVFEKSVDIEGGYSGRSVLGQEVYRMSLFTDSTFCFRHSITNSCFTYGNVKGKYSILRDTIYFATSPMTGLSSLIDVANIFKDNQLKMVLSEKQLTAFDNDGTYLRLAETVPLSNFLQTKKSAVYKNSPFSPQLSNKSNSF
jgi:hypothetical protein